MTLALAIVLLMAIPLGALTLVLVRTREQLATAQGQLADLRAERDQVTTQLGDNEQALADSEQARSALDRELATVRADLTNVTKRADTAESALRDARDHLEAALIESESVSSTLDAVRAELVSATTALASAESGDSRALWALELARSERRWQASVSPGMDLPSPFDDTADALKLAVEVEASALREEVGTRIDVAWDLSIELPDEASLLVLRLAQELLADAAIRAETLELRVGPEDDGVAVALRALDEEGEVVPVALPPLAAGRVRPSDDGVWVVARG